MAVALALVGAGGRLSSAAVLGGLFVFFLTLIRIILIRLIGICARFGAGSGSHFWVVPPFCLRISFNLFFLPVKGNCLFL